MIHLLSSATDISQSQLVEMKIAAFSPLPSRPDFTTVIFAGVTESASTLSFCVTAIARPPSPSKMMKPVAALARIVLVDGEENTHAAAVAFGMGEVDPLLDIGGTPRVVRTQVEIDHFPFGGEAHVFDFDLLAGNREERVSGSASSHPAKPRPETSSRADAALNNICLKFMLVLFMIIDTC